MTDYYKIDRLNASIKETFDDLNEINRYGTMDYADYTTLYNAIDRIDDAADSLSASPWHRLEDELPKDGEWAIFTNGKVVSVERMKHDAYNHFFPASQWFDFEDAVAWMPLPELPKEDA